MAVCERDLEQFGAPVSLEASVSGLLTCGGRAVRASAHALLVAMTGCFVLACSRSSKANDADPVPILRSFMAGYGHDLAAGDTVALKQRYDPEGFFALINGNTIVQHATDAASWDGWSRPQYFAWDSLTFDVPMPEVALVLGRFRTVYSGTDTLVYSYAALLRRGSEGWRIRTEIETPIE
jgi:hypothetical protein